MDSALVLGAPRYEPRPFEKPIGHCTHGVFDRVDREFVVYARYTESQSVKAAARYNEAYREALASSQKP